MGLASPPPASSTLPAGPSPLSMHSPLSLQLDDAAGKSGRDDGKPLSPGISSPSWKSLFRLGQHVGSSRKLDGTVGNGSNLRGAHLKLDVNTAGHSPSGALVTSPSTSPTPTSLSADQRSSYHSSNTPSTDSGTAMSPKVTDQPPMVITTSPSVPPTFPPVVNAAPLGPKRSKSKNDKQRSLGRGRTKDTDGLSQTGSHQSIATAASSSRSPLSPKAVGQSASRFLRRVASAPNTKGLFAPSSRFGSAQASPTKNGMLAPGGVVPPLPVAPGTPTIQVSPDPDTYNGNGNLSTDTTSSTSSRGVPMPVRPKPTRQWSGKKFKQAKDRVANTTLEGPGKIAFRRTYSSNSIRVGEVGTD